MSLKTGPTAYQFDGNTKYSLFCEENFSIFTVDENGEFADLVAISHRGKLLFNTTDPFSGYIKIPDGKHWTIDNVSIQSPFEDSDPIPVELPEDKPGYIPPTLQQRMAQMMQAMIDERYGHDSNQSESAEEFLTFHEDPEDQVALSGYEVQEMIEEEPISAEPDQPQDPVPPQDPEPSPDPEPTPEPT